MCDFLRWPQYAAEICGLQQHSEVFCVSIGERLRKERERLGFNQAEFAALVGKSERTQVDWEKDISSPNAKNLEALAGAGVDVGFVVTGKRTVYAKGPAGTVLTAREERLIENFHLAGDTGRRALEMTAAALAASAHVRPVDDQGSVSNLVVHGSVTGQAAGRDMTIHHQPAPPPRGPRKG